MMLMSIVGRLLQFINKLCGGGAGKKGKAVKRMVDAEVRRIRLERSMHVDENGCPGMHVLVSFPPVQRAALRPLVTEYRV